MSSLTLPSFAKINWMLKILGRREDGFHELRTVFQTLELHDRLTFHAGEASSGQASLKLSGRGIDVPLDESNLVCRAAQALIPQARRPQAVEAELDKRIPLGAGLGGGSSNAAVTLMALNRLWDCGLGPNQLSRLAAELGSDVPLFLSGGTVAGGGRGEILQPLDDLPFRQPLILIYPDLHISAAEAYRMGDWGRFQGPARLTSLRSDTTIQRFCRAAEARERLWAVLENDFDDLLYASFPLLRGMRELLEESGCGKVLISGSGSTVAGLTVPGRVEEVLEKVRGGAAGTVFSTRPVGRREYRTRLQRVY